MENILISIITPSYNSSKFIAEAIDSVRDQTYVNWELLITDDCSSDNSIDIINSYVSCDIRIKLFICKKNIGAAAARNISIKNASGRYIAFLDSDDKWNPDKLERQLAFMTNNNYYFTFTSYDLMSEDGEKLNKAVSVPKSVNYNQYLRNTIIGCLTVIIDREMVGDFEMPLKRSSHDMALWLLIMKRGIIAYGLNEVTASYRLVSNSNTANKKKAAKEVWNVYRDVEHLNFVKSVVCFCGYAFHAIKKRV